MLSILYLLFFPSFCIVFLLSIRAFIHLKPFSYFRFILLSKFYSLDLVYKGLTLYFTTLNLFFSSYYIYFFENTFFGFQFQTKYVFFNSEARFGVDGISFWFVILTLLLIPICVLISWEYITDGVLLFLVSFLALEIILILFFSALNILVLYLTFESTLIPMFVIIGIWGGFRKIKASYYFFMFTLLGSVFMLLGILIIWAETFSLDFINLITYKFNPNLESVLWLLFFIGFAVKVPIFPFHLWLPEAHVEAPTAGSVLLAGLLLKLGGYGFIRFCLTFFPYSTLYFSTYVSLFCILSVLFASFVAITQIDLKKLVAYSSIAHMNFGLLALFTMTKVGVDSCLISMLSHGLISSAMFISVDVIYRRFGTRLIEYYSGLTLIMPKYCFFLGFFCFSNIGFPGTSSFVGELLGFVALISWNSLITFVAGTSVIWSSIYSLLLFTKVAFGNYKPFGKFNVFFKDLVFFEFLVFALLATLSLVLGLNPNLCLDFMNFSTIFLIEYSKARF